MILISILFGRNSYFPYFTDIFRQFWRKIIMIIILFKKQSLSEQQRPFSSDRPHKIDKDIGFVVVLGIWPHYINESFIFEKKKKFNICSKLTAVHWIYSMSFCSVIFDRSLFVKGFRIFFCMVGFFFFNVTIFCHLSCLFRGFR